MTVVIEIGDDPETWTGAGFSVRDGVVVFGNALILLSPGAGHGITAVRSAGIDVCVDGLVFGSATPARCRDLGSRAHPNGVTAVDHLVALSPSIERTSEALVSAGLDRRRTRTFVAGGEERRQDFFWLEEVILELTGPVVGADSVDVGAVGPAGFWGLALVAADLDATKRFFGDLLTDPISAVQAGRRIATLRTRQLEISIPIAVMSPHLPSA